MSDVKFCDSCGTGLTINAMFCHKCGQKQVVPVEDDLPATDENNNREPNTDTILNNTAPETESTEVAGENDSSNFESQPEDNDETEEKDEETVAVEDGDTAAESEEDDELKQAENISHTKDQQEKEIVNEPIDTSPGNFQQEQKPIIPQPAITYQAQPQPQPSYQQAPTAQQTPYAQQAAPVPPAKKKKFPWFFTVLWLIMFVAVGIWAYLYFVHPTYDYPRFTEDAQRLVLFAVSVAALIYTLSLKLSIKKLKAIPAILMVVLGLIIFVFFCLVELQDGDFLHDTVSNLVESVIPVFGE